MLRVILCVTLLACAVFASPSRRIQADPSLDTQATPTLATPQPPQPELVETTLKIACKPGFQDVKGKCEPCAPGQFSPGGEVKCAACAAGTFAAFPATVACEPCRPGHISHQGEAQCFMCPSGSVANAARVACESCPKGRWSVAGSSECSPCPRGTFNARERQAGCQECGPGYFNPSEGASRVADCKKCSAGHSCVDAATAFPLPCDDRHFSEEGADVCLPCPKMFRANTDHTECEPTGPFYAIVAAAVCFVGVVMVSAMQCPQKEWTKMDKLEPVL